MSLFGFDLAAPPPGVWTLVDGLPHLISAGAARHLERLSGDFECAWCSGWEDRTTGLPDLLGLSVRWPYVPLGDRPSDGSHWKLAAIDRYAGRTRPLAWVDDDLDGRCRRWAAQRPGPTLLLSTQPAVGLTGAHVERLLAWLLELDPRGGRGGPPGRANDPPRDRSPDRRPPRSPR